MSKEKNNNLEIMRHSLTHIMAGAILELWPNVKFGIGPAIENGFYYDFDLSDCEKKTFVPQDLLKIEKRMKKIIQQNFKFKKKEISIEEAKEIFKDQPYKLELIEELEKNLKQITIFETFNPISYEPTNSYFIDLCAGPHINLTKEINLDAFKLTKLAGAYWKGDEKNKMLTRIYGIAFETKKELDDYLTMMTEAEKRDHRKIGKELDFFHIDEIVGSGLPLWHPKGAILWRIIEDFWYKEHLKNDYQLVRTPHIGNKILWETSGHWGFYNESMYPPLEVGQTLKESQDKDKIKDSEQFLLKPMNCPFHVQIFKNKPYSYRELPLRWAECGTVYRYEKKGELSGLTRVRGFTQDDAHIICRADQVENELKKVIDFILFIYKSFGFEIESVNVYLSVRDQESKKYAGTDEGWDFTEKVLEKVALEKKLNIKKDIGGAVFYGPKLDFKVKDAIGREWQCSTLQFDFNLPERFDMTFINDKGEKEKPFMLHRALFGSFERFIGVLIEHYSGALPFWLSPVQVQIIPISEKFNDYAEKISLQLKAYDFRLVVDNETETLGKRIRNAELQKIPYLLIVGEKEKNTNTIAVRERHKGDLGAMKLTEFLEKIKIKTK
ncbi:threonine--tRNA ligase [Candidatus Kuenenbacteria bacterium HGW-Kuenenbacteria-1]|uniref:Threonine--tRNA ligase n=1 Tax=Candidatus Kuenenbacteria bacterium HGW-Kuenenbacteria-1 TaxID=2013812 RepID=A0A2N1UNG1_9BACT|nr:MAG: threonine--tRNA ligase [Candidatus Kuenenbacteria bacterium HGW-Kuenenbacteria-1]